MYSIPKNFFCLVTMKTEKCKKLRKLSKKYIENAKKGYNF